MPLSDMQLRNAKPRERGYKLYDQEGLFVSVRPNGSRLWQMKYRFAGKEKLLSFGAYPTIGLAEARERRDAALANLRGGADPGEVRKAAKRLRDNTFKSVATTWHENRANQLVPSYGRRLWGRLEDDVFPEIGHRPIAEIKPTEILAMLRKIEDRGAITIARRLRADCSHIFQFAAAEGLVASDPAALVMKAMKPMPRTKHRLKLPTDDMPAFMVTLAGYSSERTRLAIRLLILTWARTNEIRWALRSEFEGLDGPTPLWRIPADRMKMSREHLVPLSAQAAAVARRLMMLSKGQEYLLPSHGKDGVISASGMLYAVYALGFKGVTTVHGFRRAASTWANDALTHGVRKYDSDWIEMALAHFEGDVRAVYNAAEYLKPRRDMLQDWADFLDTAAPVKGDDFDELL